MHWRPDKRTKTLKPGNGTENDCQHEACVSSIHRILANVTSFQDICK